jgi:hypothetical protein
MKDITFEGPRLLGKSIFDTKSCDCIERRKSREIEVKCMRRTSRKTLLGLER